MLKSAFGRLSTGVCRQPQWVYVGVFMYSLAGCSRFYGILFPAVYAPAWADSRSGFMSGCLCIHWLGAALSFQRIMLRRVQTAAVGLWRGVYVFIGRVAALAFQRFMLRRVQTAAVGLCRGVYVFIGRVEAGSMIGNMSYNSRGDALTTVYGFLRGLLMYLQPEYNCISRETVSYTSRGTIPHIVTNYHRAYIQRRTEHFRGCLQTPVLGFGTKP